MAQFTVKSNSLQDIITIEEKLSGSLDSLGEEIHSISNSLGFRVAAKADIMHRLRDAADNVEECWSGMNNMASALQGVCSKYESSENNLIWNLNGGNAKVQGNGSEGDGVGGRMIPSGAGSGGGGGGGRGIPSEENGIFDWLYKGGLPGALKYALSTLVPWCTDAGTGMDSSWPPERIAGAVAEYANPVFAEWAGYELKDDYSGVTAWLGRAGAVADGDFGHAEVNAYLGKVEAKGKAEAGFLRSKTKKKYVDGEWTEKESVDYLYGELEAGASFSLIDADAKAETGNDMLGAEGSADVSLLNAKAKAKGKLSIGEDGVNAYASGEAMASAVEGKVSGTINILGIEIKGEVGGYAGAVGVEGDIGIKDGKFVLKGGAAALLGVSGGIEIGVNEEGWDNFVDFITFWD